MQDSSFGAGYAHIDDGGVAVLLDYLDSVAEIAAVRDEKSAASAALLLRAGDRVLDVGCGTGVDLLDIAAQVAPGGTVHGVDPSARALEAAQRRVARESAVKLIRASAERMPFADATIDACRVDRTLQHVAEPEHALRELRRVLRPGGRLVVLEMRTSLGGTAATSDIGALVIGRLAAQSEAWLPYMLPLLLRRAGFDDVEVRLTDAELTSFEEADRALRLRASLNELVAAGAVARPRAEAWLEHVMSPEHSGSFALHLQFACISAIAA